MEWDVVISGAGLGGLCAASGLSQAGFRVLALERDESPLGRRQGYRININLAGDMALRECLPPTHYALYQDTSHRQLDPSVDIFTPDLKPIFHRAADVPANGPPPAAIDRSTLRAILLDATPNVRFGSPVADAVRQGNEVEVRLSDGTYVTCGLLIAADGISSPLRRKLLPGYDPQPLGTIAIYGKTPLDTGRHAWLPCGVLHQRFVGLTNGAGTTLALGSWHPRRTPSEAVRAIVPSPRLPGIDPYVMWVLLVPSETAPHPASSAEELHRFAVDALQHWNPAATQFVRDADVQSTFRIALRAVRSVPDWPTGRITFLGDAVHAMSPAGGEGANTALVDAASIISVFKTNGPDGIAAYEHGMRQRARVALERSTNYAHPDRMEDSRHV
jgi:2-polyprenyl-6-methoxyphenol hydroxylase-like FAD-dependent oxidoreductase